MLVTVERVAMPGRHRASSLPVGLAVPRPIPQIQDGLEHVASISRRGIPRQPVGDALGSTPPPPRVDVARQESEEIQNNRPLSTLSFPADFEQPRYFEGSVVLKASHASVDVRSLPFVDPSSKPPAIPSLPVGDIFDRSTFGERKRLPSPPRNGATPAPAPIQLHGLHRKTSSEESAASGSSFSVFEDTYVITNLGTSSAGTSPEMDAPPRPVRHARLHAGSHDRPSSVHTDAEDLADPLFRTREFSMKLSFAQRAALLREKTSSTTSYDLAAALATPALAPRPFPWTTLPVEEAKRLCAPRDLQKIVMASIRDASHEKHHLVVREYDSLGREVDECATVLAEIQARYQAEVDQRSAHLSRHVACLRAFNGEEGARFAQTLVKTIAKSDRLVLERDQLTEHISKVTQLRFSHSQAVSSLSLAKLNAAFIRSRDAEKLAQKSASRFQAERDEALVRLQALEAKFGRFADSAGQVVLEVSAPFTPGSPTTSTVESNPKTAISLSLADLRLGRRNFPRPPSSRPQIAAGPTFLVDETNHGRSPSSSGASKSSSPDLSTSSSAHSHSRPYLETPLSPYRNPRPAPPTPPKTKSRPVPEENNLNTVIELGRPKTGQLGLPSNPRPLRATSPIPAVRRRSASDPAGSTICTYSSLLGETAPLRIRRRQERQGETDLLETLQVTRPHHRRHPSETNNLISINLSDVDSSELAEMLARNG